MLLDGRIEALVDALDEGEQLWRRVQSAVSMLLGGNAGEVAFALITSLATGRSVLNARQMLLVNMLTDALPAAALAVSNQDGTEALDRDESAMWRAIAIRGTATTTGATLAWLDGPADRNPAPGGDDRADRPGVHPAGPDPGGFPWATGGFDGGGIVPGAGRGDQHAGAEPDLRLHPGGSARLGSGLPGHRDRRPLSALAPAVLERVGSKLYELVGSVVDDDDAGLDQQGVDLSDRGRQQPDTDHDEGVGPADAQSLVHDPGQRSHVT